MLGFSPLASAPIADDGTLDASVVLFGVQSDAALGFASVITSVSVLVAGIESSASVGTIPQVAIILSGVSASGFVGGLFFWSPKNVDQTLAWTNISPSDTTWSQVTPSGSPVWTEISR